MENRTDKNSYTILFAIGMVIVVGSLLAYAATGFKDRIDENKRIEKQQNILYAMGVNENVGSGDVNFVPKDKVAAAFSKYITKQLVIEGDKVSEDPNAYLIDIKKQQSDAKEGKVRKLPVFVGEKDGKKLYIVPIRGKGLWDAIWAYVAIDKNLIVEGAYFDHKGETAGLGANIKERFFMDDFIGEHLMDTSGAFKGIDVNKGNADPKNNDKTDNEVDAIAGATITGNGVTAMIHSEIKLYLPFLENLKNLDK